MILVLSSVEDVDNEVKVMVEVNASEVVESDIAVEEDCPTEEVGPLVFVDLSSVVNSS